MTFALALMSLGIQDSAVDPMRLPIGRPGTVRARTDRIVDTSTGREVDIAAIVAASEGHRFVYLGESHDRAKHHRMQADVIEALAAAGRDLVVGFEMFARPI